MEKLKHSSKELFEKIDKMRESYNYKNDFIGGITFEENQIKFPVKQELYSCLKHMADIFVYIEDAYFDQNEDSIQKQKDHIEFYLKEIEEDINSAYKVPSVESMTCHLQACIEIIDELEEKLEKREAVIDFLENKYDPLDWEEHDKIDEMLNKQK